MSMKKTLVLLASTLLLASCSKKESAGSQSPLSKNSTSIAVFVPGIMADSPIYAKLAAGASKAVDDYNERNGSNVKISIMEAGTNQAEWGPKLTSLTATGEYDVIISSNPSLPEIAEPITKQFPAQKYIFLDASSVGNESIASISYNQKDQAYLSGYIAGLYSKNHKVALVAAQEYPVMNNVLHPYFAKGAEDAFNGTTCEFRIVGNWYDASKGAEITDALVSAGVDVILPICGGASRGVISSAQEKNINLVWFDENGFSKAEGTIISSCSVQQEKAAYEITSEYLAGKTIWGETKVVGFKEDYIEFIDDDPIYLRIVPENIREEMSSLIKKIKSGEMTID